MTLVRNPVAGTADVRIQYTYGPGERYAGAEKAVCRVLDKDGQKTTTRVGERTPRVCRPSSGSAVGNHWTQQTATVRVRRSHVVTAVSCVAVRGWGGIFFISVFRLLRPLPDPSRAPFAPPPAVKFVVDVVVAAAGCTRCR